MSCIRQKELRDAYCRYRAYKPLVEESRRLFKYAEQIYLRAMAEYVNIDSSEVKLIKVYMGIFEKCATVFEEFQRVMTRHDSLLKQVERCM